MNNIIKATFASFIISLLAPRGGGRNRAHAIRPPPPPPRLEGATQHAAMMLSSGGLAASDATTTTTTTTRYYDDEHHGIVTGATTSFPPIITAPPDCPADGVIDESSRAEDPRMNLCYLLDENRIRHDIVFNLPFGFHNHLPYYLIALWRLGANSTRLDAAADSQNRYLCPPRFPSGGRITEENWISNLGRYYTNGPSESIMFLDYREFYANYMEEHGPTALLHKVYPHLIDGLGGNLGVLHGLIELGYSVESNDTAIMIDGLSWMSTSSSVLPNMNLHPSPSNTDPVELLRAMQVDERLPSLPGTEIGSIANPLSLLAGNYSHVLAEYDLYLDEGVDLVRAMRDVSNAVLVMFASHGYSDFFIIHALTSTRAVEVLLPTMTKAGWDDGEASSGAIEIMPPGGENTGDGAGGSIASDPEGEDLQRRAIAMIWKFVTYVYVARGRPTIQPNVQNREGMDFPDPDRTWSDLIERTIMIDDAHLPKLVLLFRSNFYNHGRDPLYAEAALRSVEFFEAGACPVTNVGYWCGEGLPSVSCESNSEDGMTSRSLRGAA